MKVTFEKTNYPCTLQKRTVKSTPVSFCGTDKFVKAPIQEEGFWQAIRALQDEYRPKIATLRNQHKTLTQLLHPMNVLVTHRNQDTVDSFTHFINLYRAFAADAVKNEAKDVYPADRLAKALFDFHYKIYNVIGLKIHKPFRCVMVVSKDKELAEKFLDTSEFYAKMESLARGPEYWEKRPSGNFYTPAFKLDFTKIKDTGCNNELQEALFNELNKAEEVFQKTGRKSIIFVENMERLLNPGTNPGENIDAMKEMMNTAYKDFHSTIFFHASDPSKFDPGTTVSHRVGAKVDLDKLGVIQEPFAQLDGYRYGKYHELQAAVDEVDSVIREGEVRQRELSSSLDTIKKEYRTKFSELKEKFPNWKNEPRVVDTIIPEPLKPSIPDIPPPVEETVRKFSKIKIGLVIAAVVVTVAGIFLYRKFDKKDNKPQKATPPPAPANSSGSTSQIKNSNNNMGNFIKKVS